MKEEKKKMLLSLRGANISLKGREKGWACPREKIWKFSFWVIWY